MSVRSGQAVAVRFPTSTSTGAFANADSLPTGTLIVNGVNNGAAVTVTNVGTGDYKAAVTLPTLAVGDLVQLKINATIGGVATGEFIWADTKDVAVDANGKVSATLAAADVTGSLDVNAAAIYGSTPAASSLVGMAQDYSGGVLTISGVTGGVTLTAAGLDAVLVEAGIVAGPGLTNDAGTQLTGVNARQALAAILSSLAGVLVGAATTAITVKPAGKPAGADRIDATVTVDGDRTAVSLRVPT